MGNVVEFVRRRRQRVCVCVCLGVIIGTLGAVVAKSLTGRKGGVCS